MNDGFVKVKHKTDLTPVTNADISSERIIKTELGLLTPDIPLIGEESEKVSYDERKGYSQLWLLDPIDGTRELIAGNGEYCICLALVKDNIPVEGYIYAPSSGEFWYAIKDKGAFKETDEGYKKLPLTDPSPPNKQVSFPWDGFIIMKSRSHHNFAERRWIRKLGKKTSLKVKKQGSAIKFCRIAEGIADLYVKKGRIFEWDVAAGQIILEESGGGVLGFETGSPLKYNEAHLRLKPFLAFGSRISKPTTFLF